MSAGAVSQDPDFADWIARGRKVKIRDELSRRGLWSRRMEGDAGNPCPGCGGRDRFAVNGRKNVFTCRKSGVGGDAIALVAHLDNLPKGSQGFLLAVEILTGEPPPRRKSSESDEQRREREARAVARVQAEDAQRLKEAEDAKIYRERERKRAWEIWSQALPIAGTLGEAYLAKRGIAVPPGARLRALAKAPLWSDGKVIHDGPALVAAIEGPDGRFAGIEQIWIDLDQPKGKAIVADPTTGELLPAKKMRGSVKGGFVLIAKAPNAVRRIGLGEGIETVGSVYWALKAAGSEVLDGAEFRAALSLGNMAGPADGRVRHPTQIKTDKRGRARPVFVPNDEPVDGDWPLMAIEETVEELILLGDGDSDPFTTQMAMRRGAKRYARAYPWLTVRVAWPREGQDFNDQWRDERGRDERGEVAA